MVDSCPGKSKEGSNSDVPRDINYVFSNTRA